MFSYHIFRNLSVSSLPEKVEYTIFLFHVITRNYFFQSLANFVTIFLPWSALLPKLQLLIVFRVQRFVTHVSFSIIQLTVLSVRFEKH